MPQSRTAQPAFLNAVPAALTIGLLALLCWSLAQWTWQFIAPRSTPVAAASAPAVDLPAVRERVAKAALLDSHSAAANEHEVTARSTLNVKLVGMLESHNRKGTSLAIMNLNGKSNEVYAEGREIAPGVVLHRIARDHVVLRRQGVLERVDFAEKTAAAKPAAGFNLDVQQQAPGQLSFSRDALTRALQDPAQVGQLGSVTVVPGAGAAIGPVVEGSLLQKLGLQPGDMIKTVNGEPLNSSDDLPRLYQKFASSGQITLEGSRGGAPLKLTYSVKP